jgi:CheY-like chemotaxis protein
MALRELTDLVRTVERRVRERHPELALTATVAGAVPQVVEQDDDRLEQVLSLLLHHAAVAGGDERVTLIVSPAGHDGPRRRLRFEVRDHSMPADRLALENPEESGGLSPALFRRLLAGLTHELGAHRSALNGSTWWFVVSLRPVEQSGARSPRVLVADDNPVNRKVARHLLTRIGCTVDVVEDGSQAVAASRGGVYDLILMDCQMPTMDGWTAAAAIRRSEGTQRRTPIVACTSLTALDNRRRCLEVGMDGFLDKPIRAAEVAHMVSQWIEGGA